MDISFKNILTGTPGGVAPPGSRHCVGGLAVLEVAFASVHVVLETVTAVVVVSDCRALVVVLTATVVVMAAIRCSSCTLATSQDTNWTYALSLISVLPSGHIPFIGIL